MGTWGTLPTQNDTALDILALLKRQNKEDLGQLLGLVSKSRNEEQFVLGAFVTYVYYTGDVMGVDDSDGWFEEVYKTPDRWIEFYKEYYLQYLKELIDQGHERWFSQDDRSERIGLLKKMFDAIHDAEPRWKNPLFD